MPENNTEKIGLATATIVGMNAMIGAGIFAAPAVLAFNVGIEGILAYIFVVFSVWFIAQSIARVAQLFPEEGSFYTYTKQWAGNTVGLFSGASYIIGLSIGMGLLGQIAGEYLNFFFPTFSTIFLGFLCLFTIVLLNLFGAALSQFGQRALICLTLFSILTATIMSLTKIDLTLLKNFAPYGYKNILNALPTVLFGFFGFECAASLFNIVKNPERNVPKALTYSILLVGTIYILFVSSIILSTPSSAFTSQSITLTEILQFNFPQQQWIILLINISVLSAILGTIHSVIWSVSGLLTSLIKKQREFIKKTTNVSTISHATAVILVSLVILGSFSIIRSRVLFFNITNIFIVFSYLSSMIALLSIKQEWRSGQNIKTIIGIITTLFMFVIAFLGIIQREFTDVIKLFN